MRFLLKAAFWLGLVFIFLPDNSPPATNAGTGAAAPASLAGAVIDGATALCRSNVEACARGAAAIGETAQRELIRAVAAPAASATGGDTLTPADLTAPFGGIAVPAGNAPRRAPLPPRRPA